MGRKSLYPVDLAGMRFGRLTVIQREPDRNKALYCLCRCDCGTEKVMLRNNLIGGHSRSCGCLKRDKLSARGKQQNKKSDGRTEKTKPVRAAGSKITCRPCMDCIYAGTLPESRTKRKQVFCDYLNLTGSRHPCKPGEHCTVKQAVSLR